MIILTKEYWVILCVYIYRISNEFSFHTMFYEMSFHIPRTQNEFRKTSYEMKIHLRFFLSHNISKNIRFFGVRSGVFEKFTQENRNETPWFRRCNNASVCDVTMQYARNSSKTCYVTRVILLKI